MFIVNPKINLYEGGVDIFIENEKGLCNYVKADVRAIFDGFKKGENEAWNKFNEKMSKLDLEKDEFQARIMKESFKIALIRATQESAIDHLKSLGVELEKGEREKLDAVIGQVVMDTFFTFLIKEQAGQHQEEAERAKKNAENTEKPDEIKIKIEPDNE